MKFKVGDTIFHPAWDTPYEILELDGSYARLKNIVSGWVDTYCGVNIGLPLIRKVDKEVLENNKKDKICAKIAMMDKRWKDRNKSLKKKPNKILFTQSIYVDELSTAPTNETTDYILGA